MECKWWRLELCRRRQWQPTPVLLPGKSNGQRSLVGYSPWGQEESDTTEWLHFHFSLSSTGKGNGNPLQCSCLENPRDGGAWWAAVYGVAQSRTRLKRLSSSSKTVPNYYVLKTFYYFHYLHFVIVHFQNSYYFLPRMVLIFVYSLQSGVLLLILISFFSFSWSVLQNHIYINLPM